MCLSVLAYQEVGRRIEELTGAIYALDPYFVMSTDEAATLSMLVTSARHAQSARRARSPERRSLSTLSATSTLAPQPSARARSPWALGGTTYAEIVKGAGSRSSSRGEPRVPSSPAYDDHTETDMTPVLEPCVISEKIVDDPSDTRVCEIDTMSYDKSVSESCTGDVNLYYDDNNVGYLGSEPVQELYTTPSIEYQELPLEAPEVETILDTLPEQPVLELPPIDKERPLSPFKERQHELSYAEILALGLRRQPRTQSVTALPKPQVAQVELVKEIVVECVETSPTIHPHELKSERYKPERPDRLERPERVNRLERPDRPPPRSRSREMPRQRRAPEKRSTKAHDVQIMKKKKTMKKAIEVQDFDEPDVELELNPIRTTLEPLLVPPTDPVKEVKEVTKKLKHSATVVETVTEIITEDSHVEKASEEIELKKSRKKKHKKIKASQDEIQKALKEIEDLEKHKKKRGKETNDGIKEKTMDTVGIQLKQEIPFEPDVIEIKSNTQNVDDVQLKTKKKKSNKDSQAKTSNIDEEVKTVESLESFETKTKEKSKKKKCTKQSQAGQLDKIDDLLNIITVETSVIQNPSLHTKDSKKENVESKLLKETHDNKQLIVELIYQPEVKEGKQEVIEPLSDNHVKDCIQTTTETLIESPVLKLSPQVSEETFQGLHSTQDEEVKTVDRDTQFIRELKTVLTEEAKNSEICAYTHLGEASLPKKECKNKRKGQKEIQTLINTSLQLTTKELGDAQQQQGNVTEHPILDIVPEFMACERTTVERTIEENVKIIEPVAEEIPNLVGHVEEHKSVKKKKHKKTKQLVDDNDHVGEKMLKKEEECLPAIERTKDIDQEIESSKIQEESKRSKKKSKPKPKQENEGKDKDEENLTELPTFDATIVEPILEESKPHKKKKSKKQKIGDDDIDKALKEIERSEGSKKKLKEKASKSKVKQELYTVETNITTEAVDAEITTKVTSNIKTDTETLPVEEVDDIQPIEHIDWNEMLEEEEGVIETAIEPINQPISDLTMIGTEYIANQVTILQETGNIFTEEKSALIDKKMVAPLEGTTHSSKSEINLENIEDDKMITVQAERYAPNVTSPSSEQNNNDKFFSTDTLKESSLNVLEEVTHYEPITHDVETRTVYLITHEEKKLPPIRTVKIRSKSNSLEEPQTIEDNLVLSKESKNNKITNEKSSIIISDNILDRMVITEELITQESVLDSESKLIESLPEVNKCNPESEQTKILTQSASNNRCDITEDKSGVDVSNQNITSFNIVDIELQHQEPAGNSASEQLTEESFSNNFEGAIFGSVQDRNRVATEKKVNDKKPKIPYQDLVKEIKSYAVDLDTHQLDYEYTQFILSQRCSQEKDRNTIDKVVSTNIKECRAKELNVKDELIVNTANTILLDTDIKSEQDVTQHVSLEHEPRKPHSAQVTDCLISESDVEKPVDAVYAPKSLNLTETDAITADITKHVQRTVKLEESIEDKHDKEPINITMSVTEIKGSLATSVEQEPRFNYKEIQDAEQVLGSQACNKLTEQVKSINDNIISLSPLLEGIKKTDDADKTIIESINAHLLIQETNMDEFTPSTATNEACQFNEAVPRINYHEIKDAEIVLASQTNLQQVLKSEDKRRDLPQVPSKEKHAAKINSTQSQEEMKPQEIQERPPLSVDVNTSDSYTVQSADLILAERSDNYTETIRTETPHYSYQDMFDAEIQYGLSVSSQNLQTKLLSKIIENENETSIKQEDINCESDEMKHISSDKYAIDSTKLIDEVPKLSYQDISDAESLLAMRLSQSIKKCTEHFDSEKTDDSSEKQVVTPEAKEGDSSGSEGPVYIEKLKSAIAKNIPETLPEPETFRQSIFEVPRFSYHEIRDAEGLLAFRERPLQQTELTSVHQIDIPPAEDISKTSLDKSVADIVEKEIGAKHERLGETENSSNSIYEPLRHNYHEIQDAEIVLASSKSSQTTPETNVLEVVTQEDDTKPTKDRLKKITLSFEVDDLSNTPISVVYGNIEDATPTSELTLPDFDSKPKFVETDIKVDEIAQNIEQESAAEDSFEIIDYSELTDALINISQDAQKRHDKVQKSEPSDTVIKTVQSNNNDTLPQSGPYCPKTQDNHTAIQDLIKEALQESEEPNIVECQPTHELFEIDDINDTLIPLVFGDINDIEQSFKDKEQKTFSHGDKIETSGCLCSEIVNEEMKFDKTPSSVEKNDIFRTNEASTTSHQSDIIEMELGFETNLISEPKPDTISTESIITKILQSVSNPSQTIISPVTDTHTFTDVLTNINDRTPAKSETLSRVEKSPIHSLHDLLPEIDSIPEFKPSYPNTVLYSKLSADAPEFTPSYMYQTITTVSECRTDVVKDAPLSLTIKEESTDATSEASHRMSVSKLPEMQQESYSTVLQTNNELVEKTPPSVEKDASKPDIASEETHEEHVEVKSKRNKKKKKRDKEDKKVVSLPKVSEIPQLSTTQPSHSTIIASEPVNIWQKTADDGKSYAEVVAEGSVHEHIECTQVSDTLKDQDIVKSVPVIGGSQETEKVIERPESPIIEEVIDSIPESDIKIGSWAKIVACKRRSPEITQHPEVHNTGTAHPQVNIHPPMILVDESSKDSHKPDIEVDADGFIKVDRSRRSRSRSRETRSQSNMTENRETREKSENRFDALTSMLKPDEVEWIQSTSEDEKPTKKPGRKSRSSKEKEMKSKVQDIVPSTSDEDKQLKKDKKKRSSKSKETVVKPLEQKLEPEQLIKEPSQVEVEKHVIATPHQQETKKKNKKKKKDKKSAESIEAAETFSIVEVTPSAQATIHKTVDKPLLTPEFIQTPVKDKVFSEAQYWKIDPSSLDLDEIISVEIQHAPTFSSTQVETIKIEIREEDVPTQEISVSPVDASKDANKVQSATQLISQEILAMNNKTQELEAKIKEDQSLESKMADLQREIEEMLLPENDSSVMSDDSPKELTDTQTSIEFQYDELLDNISPSLATPEPECFDLKSLEESSTCYTDKYQIPKPEEDLDNKHISMSMIDSLLDDTEPISLTETQSLDHTEELLITQEEDITPRDSENKDVSETILFEAQEVKYLEPKEIEHISLEELNMQEPMVTATRLESGTKLEQEHHEKKIVDVPAYQSASSGKTEEEEISNIKMIAEKSGFVTNIPLLDKSVRRDKVKLPINSSAVTTDTLASLLPKYETVNSNLESNILLSNIDTDTNNLTNLKADTFWTDKHTFDDAEKVLIERKSVEKTITRENVDKPQVVGPISVEENISNDNSFWPEKHLYHDAECNYFLSLASKTKTPDTESSEINIKDEYDKDRDQGGSSGHTSEAEEPKEAPSSPYNSSYISMDLPGGICSWRDKSSYLSAESSTVIDDLKEIVPREDILTTLPIEPAPPTSIQDLKAAPQRTTKDELSNDIETLLEEIKDVQTRLSDLPDESLEAMEEGLREGITVLVKCEEAAEILESKVMEYRSEQEIQSLLKELLAMKARIVKLLNQARDGIHIIQNAKIEMARQAKEVEQQKEKLAKLDTWLETINNGLKETTVQSEILVEEEIIRYIEIYERYIREYEEYEIILKSITVISEDESSQSLRIKLNAMQKALEETKHLVIIEIERLRQVLLHLRSAPEIVEEDITQTDRTIDSTSMPEEVASPRGVEIVKEIPKKEISIIEEISVEKVPSVEVVSAEPSVDKVLTVQESKPEIQIVKETMTIETQTGKSLMSEPPSVADKSIICQPDVIPTYDKSITCIPPQEVEVQTCEPHSEKEMLESIQIKQTVSDGHETIEIATRPVHREQKLGEQSLLIDADYRDDKLKKDAELNIIHSLPQSFETVMFEPDETTTEVIVDADGTKRIIVKKIRKTLVTRQHVLESQEHDSRILSSNVPCEAYSQIALSQNVGATSSIIEDGGVQHIQYQTSQGQIVSNVPGGEVTVQEFVSKPETLITMDKDMKPEDILQLVEMGVPTQMQTTSSSVTAVVQQVTKRIVKTRRRIIRRIVIIDGKEHVTEEVVEEPDDVEVYEEQIPRISINVKERGDVPDEEDKDEKSDKNDHPTLPPRKDEIPKSEKSSKDTTGFKPDNKPGDKPVDKSDDKPDHKPDDKPDDKPNDRPDDKPDNGQDQERVNISKDFNESQKLENLLQEFIQKDSSHSHITTSTVTQELKSKETTPVESITVSESFEICPGNPESITYIVQEPQDAQIQFSTENLPQVGQTIITSEGTLRSTFETSSTNIATVVQRVVRKTTKTRRRIIKHITVIDGKEHVTEEVIEEPDDVEVIEEEPQITHSTETGSVTTKRVRIIKKIEIIDGKEHVTEQIVEEPNDDVTEDQILQHLPTSEVSSISHSVVDKTKSLIENEGKFFGLHKQDVVNTTNKLIASDVDLQQHQETTNPSEIVTESATTPVTEECYHMSASPDVNIEQITTLKKVHDGPKRSITITTTKTTVFDDTRDTVIPTVTSKETDVKDENGTDTALEYIQESVQSIEPEISIIKIASVTEVGNETPTDTIMKAEIVGTSQKKTHKDTTNMEIHRSFIEKEMDHTIVSKIPASPVEGKAKSETPTVDVSKHLEEKSTESKRGISTKTSQATQPSESVKLTEPSKTEGIEATEIKSTIKAGEILKEQPELVETTKMPDISKEISLAPKNTALADVMKSFIGSEMDHTIVTKDETSVKINDPKETQDEVSKESTKPAPVIDGSSKMSKITVFATDPTTQETSKTEITKADLEKDSEMLSTELYPTVENKDKSPTLSKPKDTILCDVTKSFIGSEIDHTSVTKVLPPIKLQPNDEAATESKEPDLVEFNSTKPQQKTVTKISKDVQITEITVPEDKITEGLSRDEAGVCKDTDTSETSLLSPSEPKTATFIDISKNFIDSEMNRTMISKTPITSVPKESFNIQSDGMKTRRIKIIKRIEIINGKEHVTEAVVEESDDEFVPASTIIAEIDLTLNKPEIEQELVEETTKTVKLPIQSEILSIVQPKDDQVSITPEINDGETIQSGSKTQTQSDFVKDKLTPKPQEIVSGRTKIITTEADTISKLKTSKASIDIVTQEITEQKDVEQNNLVDLTKKLLENESKQPGIINSTTTEKPIHQTLYDSDIDMTKPNIEKVTTMSIEQDLTQTTPKPTVIDTIIKEQPLSEKNEAVSDIQYTVTEDKFTSSLKTPTIIDSQLPKEEPELVIKKQPTTEFPFLHSENIFKEPQFGVIELSKEFIIQEGTGKYEQVAKPVTEPELLDAGKPGVQLITERAPTQSPIEVVPLKIGTVITESDATQLSEAPETSYIRQFEPQVVGSSDSVNKLLAVFNQPEIQDVQSQTTKVPESSTSGLLKLLPEYDISMLLHTERLDTDLRNLKPETVTTQHDKLGRTIDISMSLADHREPKKVVPKVKFDLKVEEYETEPMVVKKDIEVILPTDIRITKEVPKPPVIHETKEQVKEVTTPDLVEKQMKSKKKKKQKIKTIVSESTEIETDKSIVETDSSSLSHYVELPSSPQVDSPKPTEDVLETPIEVATVIRKTPPLETPDELSPESKLQKSSGPVSEVKSPESLPKEPVVEIKEEIVDSYQASEDVSISEEQGYEPEDLSIGLAPTPDKKKKHKKRRQHGISEDTVYPKLTSTETEDTTVTTPVEMLEPLKKGRDKKRKKKTVSEPIVEPVEKEVLELELPDEPKSLELVIESVTEEKPESPKVGTEIIISPKEESYRTMSETSDISTVKIVEECVQSSPEIATKEVPTTVTFPVQVIEEIATQEYSIQTSPEESEAVKAFTPPETSDIELQTTPTSISEVITQTTPVEDKEAHTQTVEEVKTVVEKIMSDTEIQTSRSESPIKIIRSEATTQVIPHDIATPSEKFSQTSPIQSDVIEKPLSPEIEKESREIQTSPEPEIETEEKSTEIFIQTTESDIQTVKQEIADQGTSTSPFKEKELTEISIQTPEVHLVSSFTQSDTPEPVEELTEKVDQTEQPSLPSLEIGKHEIITVDSTQQTTPREEEVRPNLEISEVVTVDNSQQTTPRETEAPKIQTPLLKKPPSPDAKPESPKNLVRTVDNTQQTSPRSEPILETTPIVVPTLDLQRKETVTIDSTQQTTPRVYSDDSISTSTSEPYEIHLKAQVTVPQATTDFLEYERQFEEPPMSILGDKYKHKKRKSKKKADSPLVQSPESLSDLINTELSMSITPTSEDVSLRDSSSIDEGISQLASPVMPTKTITQPKLTYSDVVQRSKSKSPSPSKTIIPYKSEKARLMDALEKRAQSVTQPQRSVPDDSLTIALLEPSVQNSYQLVVNKELDEVKDAIESNDPTRTERSVIIIIETISIWLEEIQYKIQRQTLTGVKTTEDNERLKVLQKNVLQLKNIIEVTEVNEEIITLIETLTRQVNAVNTLNNQSSIKVQEYEKEWLKFLDDVDQLNVSVEAVKETLDNVILSEIPTQQKLEKLDKIELTNFDNVTAITKMYKRCRSLIENNPKRECPSKLYDCDDGSKQVENAVNTERDRLLQLASLAEEYEQTLQDFGQITDVAEALLDGKIIVSDLDHLHEEIQKHRKFFVNLSHCRAILESLEDNLDNETRAKYSSLHNLLHDRATVIIDRAASRAQQMTLAASRWSLLQHGMKEEMQWLVVAQQRVPDLSNVTSMDHEQYINLYQSVSLDLSHHYAKMLRLLSITQSLQNLIVCSGLETECSVALDTLLRLQDDVDSRLTRLTAFKENWVTYDYLIDRIEGWMKVANRELEFITPDNITTTGNLRRFWELKAQHEVYNNLKNESAVQFEKALEILPVSDEMVQRQFFSKIEDKWSELASKISNIHSTAIQNISDRDVSSGEKLNILEEELRELRSAVEGLKGVIKSEDELNLYIERLQVMTSRIDRIQNELGRLSLLPTAESERLGALLTQSGNLGDQIAEELERSMLLKEKIVQVQAGIARCQKSQRRARLTLEECEAAERLGSDVVERASENCDKLIDELGVQWRDILALRQALHSLPISLRVVVSPTGVEKDISGLQETHAELEAACSDLSSRLRAKLQLWRRFERQLEMVQSAVREADYMVELLTVQGQVDYDRLLKATEKLEPSLSSLPSLASHFIKRLNFRAI
ncbi:unnamed protein product [Arctia plantaginis]|uniref:Uncharacterized protein n=1 Tax=Arctia plantaginis TaxID=874455 RepID=A0A8S0ZYZ5_ARCPL|nr:unnamed protein product [Arctia plantaginis]